MIRVESHQRPAALAERVGDFNVSMDLWELLFFFSNAALLSTVAVKYLLESQKEIENQLTCKKATKTSQPNKNQHDKGELK